MFSLITDKIATIAALFLGALVLVLWGYYAPLVSRLRADLEKLRVEKMELTLENGKLAVSIKNQNAAVDALQKASLERVAQAKTEVSKESRRQSVWKPKYDALQTLPRIGDECADLSRVINTFYSLRMEEAQ